MKLHTVIWFLVLLIYAEVLITAENNKRNFINNVNKIKGVIFKKICTILRMNINEYLQLYVLWVSIYKIPLLKIKNVMVFILFSFEPRIFENAVQCQ